jgi:hypothetical protein
MGFKTSGFSNAEYFVFRQLRKTLLKRIDPPIDGNLFE